MSLLGISQNARVTPENKKTHLYIYENNVVIRSNLICKDADIITPERFGACGNAKYLHSGIWYTDVNHTAPARDDTAAFNAMVNYAATHPEKDIGVTRGAAYLLDFDTIIGLNYSKCFCTIMSEGDGSSLPTVNAWLRKTIEGEAGYVPAWIRKY